MWKQLLEALGVLLVVTGAALLSIPLALVVAGAVIVAAVEVRA